MPRLLPPDGEHGWTPFVWLIYLSAYLIFPIWVGSSPLVWAIDAAGLVAFLALYFRGYWVEGARRLPIIAGLAVLGVALAPFNPGSLTFFVYAAAFVGGAAAGRAAGGVDRGPHARRRRDGGWTGVRCRAGARRSSRCSPSRWSLMTPIIGFVNVHYNEGRQRDAALRLAQDEIARFATLAERDRIAGDLHDLLGHTLSVIVLKSGLASKLMTRDAARAAVGDRRRRTHLARRARRGAASGPRIPHGDAVRRARAGPRRAGDRRHPRRGRRDERSVPAAASPDLDPPLEHAAALILRESITNVVRHSQATHCRIAMARVTARFARDRRRRSRRANRRTVTASKACGHGRARSAAVLERAMDRAA